jgi:hypothetical protein
MRRYLWLIGILLASAVIAGAVTVAVARLSEKPAESAVQRSYRAGLDALSRNDFAHAVEQFEAVQATDPSYLSVQSLLARARAGLAAAAAVSTTTAPAPASTAASTASVSTTFTRPPDLASLLPPSLAGFGQPQVDDSADLVSGVYIGTSGAVIRTLTISIADRKTPEAATGYVDNAIKPVYSRDAQPVVLASGVQGYFGTSGRLWATLAWVKGTVAYWMIAEVGDGRPAEQLQALTGIARQAR